MRRVVVLDQTIDREPPEAWWQLQTFGDDPLEELGRKGAVCSACVPPSQGYCAARVK